MIKLILFLPILGLFSCTGRTHNGDSIPQQQEQPAPTPTPTPTPSTAIIYRANLMALNPKVAKNATGTGIIKIDGDTFEATMTVKGVAKVIHLQRVHLGKNCPTSLSDGNSDGFIDAMEARIVSGTGFIPLDADLDTQVDGSGTYPEASGPLGAYAYHETGSLSRMLADLRGPELDSDNSVIRLGPGGKLNLADRVIIVHGVDASEPLPASVASFNMLPAQDTLPVLCGELFKVISQ